MRGDRDLIEHDVRRGCHVLGKRSGNTGSDAFDVDILDVVGRRQIAHEALAEVRQIADDDDRLAHAGVHGDRGGDLTEFDPEPADLDLLVGASDKLDVAGGVATGEVTRPIEPAT